MPSHSILPDARRAAVEAVLDDVLAEVRAVSDVTLLHECRSIFRSKVPLNLRAYVAAAMALRLAGSGARQERRRDHEGDSSRRKDGKPGDRAPSTPREPRPQTPDAQKKKPEAKPRERERPVDAPRDESEARENRYRGEGVTLFVSAGRRQRFYSRVAIRLLADTPGIQPEHIGDVRTMDNYCFIVVDPAIEETAISALNGLDFKGRVLAANRARKKGEPAPIATQEDRSDAPADEVDAVDERSLTSEPDSAALSAYYEDDTYTADGEPADSADDVQGHETAEDTPEDDPIEDPEDRP